MRKRKKKSIANLDKQDIDGKKWTYGFVISFFDPTGEKYKFKKKKRSSDLQ
jgi:hypothetical protein